MTPSEKRRDKRRQELEEACRSAEGAAGVASAAIARRDHLLEQAQGSPASGKFSFTELVGITGLSRTRIAQIIYALRKADSK